MSEDKNNTKSRLDSLKSQLMSDNVDFNASEHELTDDILPIVNYDDVEKPVDYINKKKQFNEIATEEITSIINVYIKDENLLKSARLKTKKMNYIRKYTLLLLILDMYENNLIVLQESIDMGDRSKEQYELVNKTGSEISKRSSEIDNLLLDCENFFDNYMDKYGLTSEEDDIMSNNNTENDTENTTIIKISDLNEVIKKQIEQNKEETKRKNEEAKNRNNLD